jgi:ubiquinone/menaquinone biosynthesis C-methylase UbiE
MIEHIEDDRQAMRELYRILKPGGWGIAMVPIQLDLEKTLEGLPISSEGERWKYYGQNDHVRMYAKQDFISRLQDAGFEVKQFGEDHFGKDVFLLHGLHPRSVLYVVEKPSVSS